MYDSREKAIRDREWELNATFREGEIKGKLEGEIKGKIEMIRTLQSLLGVPETDEQDLRVMNLEQLEAMTSDLQVKLRSR